MNEYFQTFQNITESVEQTLKAEPNSLELKQAATRLKESVQPCLEELRQSASRLKQLVQVSLNELDRAEDVWNSKPRVAEVSKLEFWQQLGEISGREFKIPLLGSQYKSETLKQAKKSWNERYELLKKAWFFDAKGYKSKDLGAGDKQKLLQGIRFYLDEQAKDMNLMLKEGMKFIEQELAAIINLETIQYYLSFLPQQSKAGSETKINMIISDIAEVFTDSANNSLDSLKKFDNFVNTTLENFENQNFGRLIILPQFTKFSEEQVITKIENIINSVFDDRVKLATQALEQAVAFYNDFLERQARYQQETPEQRQAQKAWINKQRQELVH
jgi:hypothetical protein